MAIQIARSVFQMQQFPALASFAAIVGPKEGEGPFSDCFDRVESDSYFGEETWEKAESRLQQNTVELALQKGGFSAEEIDWIFSGDLINQCIGSTYGLRALEIPFLGIYGACSTMAEGLVLASLLLDGKVGNRVVAATSSHFSTAERQFRFPLSYGGQRTPTAQWTCTASGAVVLGMVYNYVPYMILPLYTSMTKIDQSIVEAAQDLGASTTKTLFRVLIPMSIPGISTGITMVFVPAVSTFVISRMLGGGSNLLIGDLIEMQFLGNSYNLNVGSAMSLVLMVIVLLCMSFTSSFDEDEMEGVS